MKVTEFTRKCLEFRRFEKNMESLGYVRKEPFWELIRGNEWSPEYQIKDVKICPGGKYIYCLKGKF